MISQGQPAAHSGEGIAFETRFRVSRVLDNGSILPLIDTHNHLTDEGLIQIAKTWRVRDYPGTPKSMPGSIAVGVGSANPPANGDVALEAEVYRKNIDYATLNVALPTTTNVAAFRIILLEGEPAIQEPNGVLLAEAGLWSNDTVPKLISRVLFPAPLIKTAQVKYLVEFLHTIKRAAS